MSACANTVPVVQRRFDAYHAEQLDALARAAAFGGVAAAQPEVLHQLLTELAPSRLVVSETTFDVALDARHTSRASLSVGLDFGPPDTRRRLFHHAFTTRRRDDVRLRFAVQAEPAQLPLKDAHA